ncbi:TPA: hypothetical protein HA251_08975 [Candidatus Woesearchaeota archaeon]|nr:hypothetical protein [Candidatus Woesearchaeota archaeon]
MCVGALLKLQAAYFIQNGRDIDTWKIDFDDRFSRLQVSDDVLDRRRAWSRPVETEQGIYVLVNRLFRKSRCYRFVPVSSSTETSSGVIEYAPVPGLYGVGSIPAERVNYIIRDHIRVIDFDGEVGCDGVRDVSPDVVALKLSGHTLEGRLINVPDVVVLNNT